MKKSIFAVIILICLFCSAAYAGELAVAKDVSFTPPTDTMIWMFVTLMILNIVSKGLFVAEEFLKTKSNFLLKGLGYVFGALRVSLDGIIANTRKLKVKK